MWRGLVPGSYNLINNKQVWSENCAALLGFPVQREASWDGFLAIVHQEDRQRVLDAVQKHIESGIPYDVEYRIITGDKNIRWLRSQDK